MNCPSCNAPVLPGATFCDNCGMNLAQVAQAPVPPAVPSGSRCPGCGAENVPGSLYCDNCGAALNAPAPQVPQQPVPQVPPQQQPPQWNVPPQPQVPPQVPPQQWQQPPQQPPQQPWQPPQQQIPVPQQPFVPQASIPGRFVVVASNANLPIPPGKTEIVIGREDPVSGIFPDIDLDAFDALNQGVSRMHAKLTIQGGQVYVEDLKTANFTSMRGQRLNPGQRYPLNHGDELAFGRLRVVYYAS